MTTDTTHAPTNPSRRSLLTAATAAGAAALLSRTPSARAADRETLAHNGRINQSVCLWCYGGMTSAQMAHFASRIGLKAIDLLTPDKFPPLKEAGLICSMTSGVWGGIERGLNRREHHDAIVKSLKELIDANAEHNYPNVICFSGNRAGQTDDDGIKICAEGIKKIVAYAEQKKVTLCMELLNSRVDHKDYQCDHTVWGVELCKAVGSDRFKLLYDIYHMQIMEGDVIRTIRNNKEYLAHFHTGGVPGRHEIDDSQELYYPAIMKAIADTGYKGYCAQEFIPSYKWQFKEDQATLENSRSSHATIPFSKSWLPENLEAKHQDRVASLAQAAKICDV
jgi:hydroxypyruvate isomerase